MRPFPVLALLLAAGCGGLGYDGVITARVDLEANDINAAVIAEERSIDEEGEPWVPFVNQARGALGKEPREIVVRKVTLQIDVARSESVGKLEDALKDDVVVYFKGDTTGAIVDIARRSDPEGSAAVELSTTGNDLSALQDQLVRGAFKVGVRGGTTKLRTDKFKLALSVGLELTAR